MVKSNINQYLRNNSERRRRFRLLRSPLKAAKFLTAKAKEFAPKKRGFLVAGIRYIKRDNKTVDVISTVPGVYPYNLWIDERTPFKRVRMVKRFLSPKLKRRAGKRDRLRVFYREYETKTGMPGFFTKATQMTRLKYPFMVQQEIRGILRSTITR